MTIEILYVDDEPDLREVATIALEIDPELHVRACGSGAEALAILETWTPDLVLLDMMMPDMDGPTTHSEIRRRFGSRVPIVYITARAQEHERQHLMSLGALGVIAKPFDAMTLATQVHELVDRV